MRIMGNAAESFLYIWYDTKNKMFYLGKHKGTPIDSYTHSSTIMESFNKDNIPSHMRRRILAYGTDEDMCLLEHECLKNRKEKKWDRYYNVHVGDPRHVTILGEDHPSYKHGKWVGFRKGTEESKKQKSEYDKKRYQENKEKIQTKQLEYRSIENKKIEARERSKKWYADNKERRRKYNQREDVKEKNRIRYHTKKAERLASGV
jgi:hypothetical protein